MIGGRISRSGRGAATELGRVVGPHTYGLWRSLVSALVWGTRGREFESPQPDWVSRDREIRGNQRRCLLTSPTTESNELQHWRSTPDGRGGPRQTSAPG